MPALLLSSSALSAQQPLQVPVPTMRIVTVQGEAAIHKLRQPAQTGIAVIVRDGNRRPLSNASVTFTLPREGPGAVFSDGSYTATVESDADGYAAVQGLHANGMAGQYRIQVEARYRDQSASSSIAQFNMAVSGRKKGNGKWMTVGLIAGAAAAGAVFGLQSLSKSQSPAPPPANPIGITAGAGSVGPPR